MMYEGRSKMTQEERWMARYQEAKSFIETNKRNPSKYIDEERGLRNWVRHQQKLINKGELKPERVELFNQLLSLAEANRHVNQWKYKMCYDESGWTLFWRGLWNHLLKPASI